MSGEWLGDDGAVTKPPVTLIGQIIRPSPNLLLGNSRKMLGGNRGEHPFDLFFSNGISKISKDFNENFLRFDLYGTGYFVLKKRNGMHR